MLCEPLVENYRMSSEGLTQDFSPRRHSEHQRDPAEVRTAEGWKSMSGIFEGKDFAQPHEFDGSVARSALRRVIRG